MPSNIHLISTNYNQRHIPMVPSHGLHKKLVNKHNKHVWKTSTKYLREFHYPTSKHIPMVLSHALQGRLVTYFSHTTISQKRISKARKAMRKHTLLLHHLSSYKTMSIHHKESSSTKHYRLLVLNQPPLTRKDLNSYESKMNQH